VSANCQPWGVHKQAVWQLEQEFFKQGDQERALGMPVMPMMDRYKDSAANSQVFFMSKLVRPLLDPCIELVDKDVADALGSHLEENMGHWITLTERYPKLSAQEILRLEEASEDDSDDSSDSVSEQTRFSIYSKISECSKPLSDDEVS